MQKKKDNSKNHENFSQCDRKILLVEDNLLIQTVCSHHLRSLGCEFSVAETGTEALDQLLHFHFDLVLLDINLPDISGIEVCKEIRKAKTESEIPIIFLTAYSQKHIRQKAFLAGGNDFYVKPVTREELSQIINNWIYKDENFSNI